MLDSLRKSAGSWFVKILLGVLVLSFAVWGVGDMFRTVSRQKLAEVGDREISASEFQRAVQTQIALVSNRIGRRLTSAEVRDFQIGDRVMDNLVGTTAVAIHADKLNLGISQDAIVDAIRTEPSFQGGDGKFDQQRFQEVLRSNGLDEPGFIRIQREEMVRGQLMDALTRGAYVPKTLLDAANHYRNDERVLKYFVLPPEAAGTVDAPDETVLRSHYDTNKLRHMAPEYRKIGVLALTPDAIKDTIALTDEEVKASFEATKDSYSTPERRTIQQLIFKDMAAAQDAHKKLTDGADFAALGTEIGMKETDMALGTMAKSQLADRKIADAAFALEQGKFSAPIDSFSPVIVKVTEITPGSQKTFEEVKDQVHDALAKSRAAEEISKLYDAIEDERASGSNVAETAKKLNLPYAEYTLDAAGNGQDGKPVTGPGIGRDSLQLAFTSDVGVENSPVTIGEGYSFLEVREVIPERQKTFEEVRDQVQAAWITDETRKRLRQKADELVLKLKGGAAIETVAQEVSAEVATTPPLKRDATPQGLPRTALPLAFSLGQNDFGTVQMPDRKSQAILQVTEIKPATPLDEKQAEALREELRRSVGVDILTQYVGGLQRSYGVTRNDAAISAAVGQQ